MLHFHSGSKDWPDLFQNFEVAFLSSFYNTVEVAFVCSFYNTVSWQRDNAHFDLKVDWPFHCHALLLNNDSINNELFYSLFLQMGAHSPLQCEETREREHARTHTYAHVYTHTHTHTRTHTCTHTHTHTVSTAKECLKSWDFRDLKDESVFADLTLHGRLFQTDGAA